MNKPTSPRRRVTIAFTLMLSSVVAVFVAAPAPTAEATAGGSIAVAAANNSINGVYGCVVRTDRTLECWGSNTFGQLGTGSRAYQQDPVPVANLELIDMVDTFRGGTCAADLDGTLHCWGYSPQVPDGLSIDRETPFEITSVSGVVDIAMSTHSCVVEDDGEVWCWGDNTNGKVGTTPIGSQETTPVKVVGITDAVDVEVDRFKTCVLHQTGLTSCFGLNSVNEFGPGVAPGTYSSPVMTNMQPAESLAMGGGSVCVLDAGGDVYCYGSKQGNATSDSSLPAEGLGDVVLLANGSDGVCAVRASGQLFCWGSSTMVGIATGGVLVPTAVPGESNVTGLAMTVRDGTTCITRSNGTVACFGRDPIGDQVQNVPSPTSLQTVAVSDISVGAGHACALTTVTGEAVCWGDRNIVLNQVGLPVGPVTVTAVGSPLTALAAGGASICGSTTSGTINCREFGVDITITGFPSTIDDLDSSPAYGPFSEPPEHRCAVSNGEVWCAGQNDDGPLGNNSTANTTVAVEADFPVATAAAVEVSTGGRHSCSRHVDGTAWCWGKNFSGQLGDGSNTDSLVPVQVTGFPALMTVTSIAAGADSTCAALSNGEAWCWGSNNLDRLGLGSGAPSTASSNVALKVDSSTDVAEVAVGSSNACYLKTSGAVWCWGDLRTGARGDGHVSFSGGPAPSTHPADPAPIPSFSAQKIDGFYSQNGSTFCAVGTDDSAWCWGENRAAVTGVETETPTPVDIPIQGVAIKATTTTTTTTTSTTTTTTTSPAATTSTTSTVPGGTTSTTIPSVGDPDVFTPVAPARLLETRPGQKTIDGEAQDAGRQAGGSQIRVSLAGRAGIPVDATAAVVNVTAIRPTSVGFLTVHQCLSSVPTSASLNYVPGSSLGNEVVAALDSDGDVCVFTSAETDLAVDVVAYVASDSPYRPSTPSRLVDTRPTGTTIDGEDLAGGRVAADDQLMVQVTGRAGIPAGSVAATLNIAAVAPGGVGFVTVHPCLDPRPLSASLNYTSSVNRSNEIIAPLDPSGRACVYTSAEAHLVIDVVGSLPAGSGYVPVSPARFLDTRATGETIDNVSVGGGPNPAGEEIRLQLAGRGDVPADAEQVSIYLSAIRPSMNGFVTVHPCLDDRPLSSSLNYAVGINGGNDLIVELDATGAVCIYTSQTTHVSVDVAGYTT